MLPHTLESTAQIRNAPLKALGSVGSLSLPLSAPGVFLQLLVFRSLQMHPSSPMPIFSLHVFAPSASDVSLSVSEFPLLYKDIRYTGAPLMTSY